MTCASVYLLGAIEMFALFFHFVELNTRHWIFWFFFYWIYICSIDLIWKQIQIFRWTNQNYFVFFYYLYVIWVCAEMENIQSGWRFLFRWKKKITTIMRTYFALRSYSVCHMVWNCLCVCMSDVFVVLLSQPTILFIVLLYYDAKCC